MILLELLGWGSLATLVACIIGWLILAGLNNSRGDAD